MNYYQILGVASNANYGAIKYAYKQLAVRYHPDKNPENPEAEARFKEINNAYQTLSDPIKRAAYDNTLRYGAFEKTYTDPYRQYRYATYQKQRRSFFEKAKKYKKQRNRKANIWTIGIVSAISIIFLSVSWYNRYLDQQEENRLNALDQETIQLAHEQYTAGIFNDALLILENYLKDQGNRKSVKEAKKAYLDELTQMANHDYEEKHYRDALRSFKIIFNYQDNLPLDTYNKVAKSSRIVGNFDDAISAYQHLANKLPHEMEPHLQIALIYTYNLVDYKKAVEHFNLAKEITIKSYIEMYGKAFVLVFDPKDIPESHYLLYSGLGYAASKAEEYQVANDALEWAIILRPDRPEAYYINGIVYQQKGARQLACDNWSKARAFGMDEAIELMNNNCY